MKFVPLCSLFLIGLVSLSISAPLPDSPNRPNVKQLEPTNDTGPKIDANELPLFRGDETFDRPDKGWGFRVNLKGFRNGLETVPSQMNLVGFGIREEKSGVTLAHFYVNTISGDTATTAASIVDGIRNRLGNDIDVDLSSVRRSAMGEIEIVEYRKKEMWDKPLMRQHMNAVYTHKGTWVNLHLSKTEFTPADTAIFRNVVSSFVLVDPYHRPPNRVIRPESTWVDTRYRDSINAILRNAKKSKP